MSAQTTGTSTSPEQHYDSIDPSQSREEHEYDYVMPPTLSQSSAPSKLYYLQVEDKGGTDKEVYVYYKPDDDKDLHESYLW